MSQSFVHYHSPFLFDLLNEECRRKRGLLAVTLSVASIEALIGDLELTLVQRRDAVKNAKGQTEQRSLPGIRRFHTYPVPLFPELSPLELSMAVELEKLRIQKVAGLAQYYVLYGLLDGEETVRDPRAPSEIKKTWEKTLPKGVPELFELRNSVIHRHGSEFLFNADGELTNETAALPKVIQTLKADFGIDLPPRKREGWLGPIDRSEAVAIWSRNVAREFIAHTLDRMPDTDACRYFKQSTRM